MFVKIQEETMKRVHVRLVMAMVGLLSYASSVTATIHFNDGGTHEIDYQVSDVIQVDSGSPGQQTTLNIVDGATIPVDYPVSSF